MDAYKKLNTPKGAALHIEFSAEPPDEKAELRAAIREVAEKMEYMGDRFLEGKQKENETKCFFKGVLPCCPACCLDLYPVIWRCFLMGWIGRVCGDDPYSSSFCNSRKLR